MDTEHVENILACYDQAMPNELEAGAVWYPSANDYAATLAVKFDVSVVQAAAVIAALSPQLSWERNVQYAEIFLASGDAPTLKKGVRKAERIVLGESPDSVFAAPAKDPTSGEKVRNFYACIVNPAGNAVCIDRHAYDIALGVVGDDKSRKMLGRRGVYSAIADAYRVAASVEKVSPSVMQATTWLVWKNTKEYVSPNHTALYQSAA